MIKVFDCSNSAINSAVRRGKFQLRYDERNSNINWNELISLYQQGCSAKELATKFNTTVGTIQWKMYKLGIKNKQNKIHTNFKYDWELLQKEYNSGLSYSDLIKKFGVSEATLTRASKKGTFKSRSNKEGNELACKQGKRKFSWSEEGKQRISKSRKKFLEENPDKVPYLLNHSSKGPSYPEQYFIEVFKNRNIDIVYHHRVGTYQLDFALVNIKIGIEIDGEQHYVDKKIVIHDKKRYNFLSNEGWKILRVRWKDFKKLTFEEKVKYIDDLVGKYESKNINNII